MSDDERYKLILDTLSELKDEFRKQRGHISDLHGMMKAGAKDFYRIDQILERLETGHTRHTCRINTLEREQHRQKGFIMGIAAASTAVVLLAGALGTLAYHYFDARLDSTVLYLHYLDDRGMINPNNPRFNGGE